MSARGPSALLLAVFLVATCPASATELGRVATTMAPGTWATVSTTNIAIISQYFAQFSGVSVPAYDSNVAAWNSKKRKMMVQTVTDAGLVARPSSPLFFYDDDTNTWSAGASPGSTGFHAYDAVAWDDANEVLYWRPGTYGQGIVNRYCVNNTPAWCAGRQGTWTTLPNATATGGCYQIGVGLTYHATMDGGSLLCYDSERGIIQFRESTGTWSGILPGSHVGANASTACAEYSPIKRLTVFGCGGGTGMRKIDDNKAVTRLQNAPVSLGLSGASSNHDMVAEPITGNFIVIESGNRMYELNPDGGGSWTLVDGNLTTAGKICAARINSCSNDFYGAANPTYGVIMYWKYTGPSSGELWVYKHPSSGSPLPPLAPSALNIQ
jgi:hypothetical protein